jgi:hypothetical protein
MKTRILSIMRLGVGGDTFQAYGHRMEARTDFGARLDTLIVAFYIETLNNTSQDVKWTMNDTRKTAPYLESSLLLRRRIELPLKLNPFF